VALTLAAALLAGCGGERAGSASHVHVASGCNVIVDDSALRAFYAAVDRVAAGEELTQDDFGELVALPSWEHWRASFGAEEPRLEPLTRILLIAMRGPEPLSAQLRSKPVRTELLRNFELTIERRAEIEQYVDTFIADELACGVFQRLEPWLPASLIPDTLTVEFVPAYPQIRLYEQRFLVDPSMAWASGREQIVRFLASTLYRDRTSIAGEDPRDVGGAAIALESLRLVRNEAVAAYLDRPVEVAFDPRHQSLVDAGPDPDMLCRQATRTLMSLDRTLTHLRRIDAPTDDMWRQVFDLFVGAQSWMPTGWYMATVIADRLGEDALQEADRSVTGFWTAYNRAARRPARGPVAPPGSLEACVQQAPQLSAENAAWIEENLHRRFG
jgi:hypothetical protein